MSPISHGLEKGGERAEVDAHVALADGDPINDGLHDPMLLVLSQTGPPAIEITRVPNGGVRGREADLQEVDFALEARNLVAQAPEALVERPIPVAKSVLRQLACCVEVKELVHLPFDLGSFCLQGLKQPRLLMDRLVGRFELLPDCVFTHEEAAKLLVEDGLQISGWDLVPAAVADVFRRVRRYVHLLAAVADHGSGKEMTRLLRWFLAVLPGIQNRDALIPELFRNDRINGSPNPVFFRLQIPGFAVAA